MSWLPSHALSPAPTNTSSKVLNALTALGIVLFASAIVIFALSPRIFLYTALHQRPGYPPGVYCASCAELWAKNRDLFGREGMGCFGGGSVVETGSRVVMFGDMVRCWALERGKDEWLRPIGGGA